MNQQERLFQAIGEADPYLIARSEKQRRSRRPAYCFGGGLSGAGAGGGERPLPPADGAGHRAAAWRGASGGGCGGDAAP